MSKKVLKDGMWVDEEISFQRSEIFSDGMMSAPTKAVVTKLINILNDEFENVSQESEDDEITILTDLYLLTCLVFAKKYEGDVHIYLETILDRVFEEVDNA